MDEKDAESAEKAARSEEMLERLKEKLNLKDAEIAKLKEYAERKEEKIAKLEEERERLRKEMKESGLPSELLAGLKTLL